MKTLPLSFQMNLTDYWIHLIYMMHINNLEPELVDGIVSSIKEIHFYDATVAKVFMCDEWYFIRAKDGQIIECEEMPNNSIVNIGPKE